jgi:carbon monoxide dehydrogenase subunit G
MRLTQIAVLLAALSVPVLAHADAPDPAKDPQVARLLQAKKTLKWNYAPAGTSDRYGHAEALVAAPADAVAKVATEYGKYKTLHRKFATARVIAKEGPNTDVYMRYPVQIGMVKIEFFEVMRFGQPRMNGATHIIEGTGIKGDMKTGRTVISVRPVDAKHSLITVDVLLVPKVPAPQFLIDEELRDGAEDFVNGLKDRAQGFGGPVTQL